MLFAVIRLKDGFPVLFHGQTTAFHVRQQWFQVDLSAIHGPRNGGFLLFLVLTVNLNGQHHQ